MMVDRLEFRFPGVETGCSNNNLSNKKELKGKSSNAGGLKIFPKNENQIGKRVIWESLSKLLIIKGKYQQENQKIIYKIQKHEFPNYYITSTR